MITAMKTVKIKRRCKLAVSLLIFAPMAVLAPSLSTGQSEAPRVRVLVLDALDGKPQAGVNVIYLCDEIPHSVDTFEVTDKTGRTDVPFTCQQGNRIELVAVPNNRKEGCGSGAIGTLERIESEGVISAPGSDGGIWCPDKISRKLTPVPGQVILFVKKPTWWQSHVAG